MIATQYRNLTPITKRAVHVLTILGGSFPDCHTLEVMTRVVIRAKEFNPEKVIGVFKKFQVKARAVNNPVLLQGSAFLALSPLLAEGKLPADENDLLRTTIALLPPVILMTRKQNTKKFPDPKFSAKQIMGTEGSEEFEEKVRSSRGKTRSRIIDETTKELLRDPESARKMLENLKQFFDEEDE